jgi:1,4-alpha-glucan branching enzyme
MRGVVTQVNDSDRNLGAVKDALQKKMASDVFTRVVYTENHDQVGHPPGQNRLPTLIDVNDHESVFAKKRSTLAAAIMLTSPGIPMIFQGQEMLETRDFGFKTPTAVDFNRATDAKFKGIVQMYHDMIALRRCEPLASVQADWVHEPSLSISINGAQGQATELTPNAGRSFSQSAVGYL